MIRPGVLRVEVVERADGGAEMVGDWFYCLAMFARAQHRQRPSVEAVLERAILAAIAAAPSVVQPVDFARSAQLELYAWPVVPASPRPARRSRRRSLRCAAQGPAQLLLPLPFLEAAA